MCEFIRVHGNDPYYEGRKTYMYITLRSIQRVCPIYGVKREFGGYWRCTHDDASAEIISYQIIDFNGYVYTCGNREELEKLGFIEPQTKSKIGFLNQDKGEKIEIEMKNE